MDYWNGRCPLTGITEPSLLRASHIVAWADCETDALRLNVHNGLLLSALWDGAFDAGEVLRSPGLNETTASALQLTRNLRLSALTDATGSTCNATAPNTATDRSAQPGRCGVVAGHAGSITYTNYPAERELCILLAAVQPSKPTIDIGVLRREILTEYLMREGIPILITHREEHYAYRCGFQPTNTTHVS